MYTQLAALGALVGFLVSTLGIGAGAVATPSLMLLGVPSLKAVGSSLLYALPLKAFTSTLYHREGEVDLTRVKHLLLGALPALLTSYLALTALLSTLDLEVVSKAVKALLGLALIATSLQHLTGPQGSSAHSEAKPAHLALLGSLVGALILLTSVGSGVIVMAALLRLRAPPRRAVGTALLFSLTVTAAAALLHLSLKTVDLTLALTMLAAGIPAAYLGFKAAAKIPRKILLKAIALAIMSLGALMLIQAVS